MSALDSVKEIAGLIQKYNDLELFQKIVSLQGEVVSLSARNFELEKKCTELKATLDLKKNLKHSRQLYFLEGDPVPFCPWCYEGNGKLIHLFAPAKKFDLSSKVETWECHNCDRDFHANPNEYFRPKINRYRTL